MIALEGRVAPHTDPVLKRNPRCYARLVCDMSSRGLVSFGPAAESTVGVFVVPKTQGKQTLILDTRRVNQHSRRPWHCALPTPSSWAGLQLPVNRAYHMAQTDVNTAFYRILAPDGKSEYFIFPSVSILLLMPEGLMWQRTCDTRTSYRRDCRFSQWVPLGLSASVKGWWRAA